MPFCGPLWYLRGMFKAAQFSNLLDLQKFYRRAPKQFARASAGMLNNMAFQTRVAALENIQGDMNVRADRFVSSRVRVDRARPGPMSGQQAQVGSVSTSRFSGWVEQEEGKAPQRNRVMTVAARRGNESNKVTGKARLKASNQFFTPSDFDIQANDDDHRTVIFLQIMAKKHANRPFIMRRKYRKMRKGVYKFSKRGKLKQLQRFDEPPKPQRKRWMRPARESATTRANIRKQWGRAISHVLR